LVRCSGARADWEGWNRRSLAGDDIVRLILDGTVVRVRLDRKATNISLLVRSDGQKVLLSVRAMGGESEAAWRAVLDDLIAQGCGYPTSSSSTKAKTGILPTQSPPR
jgi:putative transposase